MLFNPFSFTNYSKNRPVGDPYSRRNRSVVFRPYHHNKYQPHQGEQEKARRLRQLNQGL